MFERLKHFAGALVPLSSIFAQRFADDLLKLSRSLPDITRERRWFFFKDRRHDFSWGIADEWRMPRYHFVKDYAEAPDIGTFINRRAARLLGRHITNGSQHRSKIGLNK